MNKNFTMASLVLTMVGCRTSESEPGPATVPVPAASHAPAAPSALRNVDVTVAFPLPESNDLESLLRPEDQGRDGPLLPSNVFADGSLPDLDVRAPLADDEARRAALRVVALRFDPCPGVVMPPRDAATCQPQIRLIFQSLQAEGRKTIARDGALHAFYRLVPDDFARVLDELRRMRAGHASDPPVPLGIHPWAQQEGLHGAYATTIRALVTRWCGESNLVRVTSFRRIESGPLWEFAIRERPDGAWLDRPVATTDQPRQTLRTISGGRWDAMITPPGSHHDDPTRVFRVQQKEEAEAFTAVGRVLDPRAHSSESLDCASCHIAADVAQFGVSVRNLSLATFASSYPLDVTARSEDEAIGFENVHMISYFGDSFSVSPRVANETAVILEFLNGP